MGENSRRRVVITGLGIISPVGVGTEETWDAIIHGRSGIGPITRFDTTDFATKIAGEVKGFKAEEYMAKKEARRMDLFIQYAVAAAQMALDDANYKIAPEEANRVGVYTGCGLGGLWTLEKYHSVLVKNGPKKVSPFFIPMMIANMAPGQISIYFGAKGPNLSVATACAAGTHAIGEAFKMIQRGQADVMLSGGVEATITPLALAGFNAMKAISTRNDEPEKASRPFEKNRDGFVLAEGCGILILEELEHALERGVRIYAEIIGYGASGDAFHIAAPAPEGRGAASCMKMALKDAGIEPADVQYINAHGTSTDLNDKYETQAIKTVFGEHSKKLAVSSTKSMTGHLLGAAGGVEGALTALSIYNDIAPPTINYEEPDPECDLDYVPNVARKMEIKVALSNSFGFGGTNATLILKKFEQKR